MLRRLPYPGLAAAIALAIVVGVPAATLFLPRTPPPSRPQPASVPIPPSPRPESPSDLADRMIPPWFKPESRAERRERIAVGKMAVPAVIAPEPALPMAGEAVGRERFARLVGNGVVSTAATPLSTLSMDVDTASYSFVRRSLQEGVLPPLDAVRVEEMINYFQYDYPRPSGPEVPLAMATELFPTPWNPRTKLLRLSASAYAPDPASRPPARLVFLVDVSGSMQGPDRLQLLVNGLRQAVEALRPDDSVAIVTYAGQAGTLLEPTSVREKWQILMALSRLSAGGGTAGGEGIRQAYALAKANADPNAINRVVLATDGDFNVGITEPEELKGFVARQREEGVYLSVLGFGRGNYNDVMMQALAQNGNGQAFYIDRLAEARRVLVDGLTGTLMTVAKDAKIQVEFNPALVREYRLIGYETRLLRPEDFRNDAVDAGDVGAGQTVTALYELALTGERGEKLPALRYQPASPAASGRSSDELATIAIRYRLPAGGAAKEEEVPVRAGDVRASLAEASLDGRFAAAVAAFGQKLRGGEHLGSFGWAEIAALAQTGKGPDPQGERAELVSLVRAAAAAEALPVPPR